MSARVRVLVVDDSAFARKVVREALAAQPDLEVVGTARDGLEALELVASLAPDVLTLDLAMPHLDGHGVLRALAGRPAPRVVVVSTADSESAQALEALALGAVEVVHKPTALATDRLLEVAPELLRAVRVAAQARAPGIDAGPRAAAPPAAAAPLAAGSKRLVVLGASTGGPQAVTRVLRALPAGLPVPVAVVVHLPPGYTAPFAERLDRECALEVVEARDGILLEPGRVVIAHAGLHLVVRREGRRLAAGTSLAPHDGPHRPSVDVLLASAAAAVGSAVLGVVMTGMGEDGLAGARAVRAAGGEVLTEAESTCVVYGMPRAIHEAGLSTADVPLGSIAEEILRRL